jgi:hypothetical protein
MTSYPCLDLAETKVEEALDIAVRRLAAPADSDEE